MRKLTPELVCRQACLKKLMNEIQVELLGEPTNERVHFKG